MRSDTTALLSVYFGYHLFAPWICQGEQKERSCLIIRHLSVLSILSIELEIQLYAAFSPSEQREPWGVGYAAHPKQLNPASCKAAFPQRYCSLISVLMDNGIEAAP